MLESKCPLSIHKGYKSQNVIDQVCSEYYTTFAALLTLYRQVQDLERQLSEARAQLERARASEHFADQQAHDNITLLDSDLPDVSRSPRRMLKARPPRDLSSSRAQLVDVGRGILKPPITTSNPTDQERGTLATPALPPYEMAQHCLESYLQCFHQRYPVLHWPQFYGAFFDLYATEASSSMARESIALCFAVLGLGAYFSHEDRVKSACEQLMQQAFSRIDFWVDKIGMEQAIACFLISVYLAETNRRSAGFVWLGSSIRIAQDRGLHVQGGNWSAVEGEVRKRTWYTLYVCDR